MKKAISCLSAFLLLLGCTTSTDEPEGLSHTGELLRKDVTAEIASHEDLCMLLGHKGMPAGGLNIVKYETTIAPKTSSSIWEEIWTVQRKGYVVKYEIRFIPLKKGGYRFTIAALFDEDDYK